MSRPCASPRRTRHPHAGENPTAPRARLSRRARPSWRRPPYAGRRGAATSIETSVAKAGGVLLSEQVELDGSNAKDGFINLTATFSVTQEPALQPLLYDLEAGMPYLFIETLDAQSPLAFGEAENGHMRVTIALTGNGGVRRHDSSRWSDGLPFFGSSRTRRRRDLARAIRSNGPLSALKATRAQRPLFRTSAGAQAPVAIAPQASPPPPALPPPQPEAPPFRLVGTIVGAGACRVAAQPLNQRSDKPSRRR